MRGSSRNSRGSAPLALCHNRKPDSESLRPLGCLRGLSRAQSTPTGRAGESRRFRVRFPPWNHPAAVPRQISPNPRCQVSVPTSRRAIFGPTRVCSLLPSDQDAHPTCEPSWTSHDPLIDEWRAPRVSRLGVSAKSYGRQACGTLVIATLESRDVLSSGKEGRTRAATARSVKSLKLRSRTSMG